MSEINSLWAFLIGYFKTILINLRFVTDLAVAIGDQVELLKRNGTLVGVTLQQFRNLKALAFDDMRHEFIVSDMDGENDTIYRVQLSDKKGPSPIVPDTPDDVKVLIFVVISFRNLF